jgi:hypothetical protein
MRAERGRGNASLHLPSILQAHILYTSHTIHSFHTDCIRDWRRCQAGEEVSLRKSKRDSFLTATLTATPTNFREKGRSAANDGPCKPASGGHRRILFASIRRCPPACRVKNLTPLYISSGQGRGLRCFLHHRFLPVDSNLTATALSRSCSREIWAHCVIGKLTWYYDSHTLSLHRFLACNKSMA